jgi:putative acetyltransferase
MVTIRPETWNDIEQINSVNITAFQGSLEALLVRRLREADAVTLSLVAEVDGEIAGHILFSPVTVEFNLMNRPFVGLAPLAVKPAFQNQKIGAKLVRAGLVKCMGMGWQAAFVLGAPEYYSRFGFRRADESGLVCEYDETGDHFMVVALRPGGLDGVGGLVSYHPIFNEVGV